MLRNQTLINILKKLNNTHRIIYKANPGNAGDSVIASATYDFFENNDFQFSFWKPYETYSPERDILLYSGGGNLIE